MAFRFLYQHNPLYRESDVGRMWCSELASSSVERNIIDPLSISYQSRLFPNLTYKWTKFSSRPYKIDVHGIIDNPNEHTTIIPSVSLSKSGNMELSCELNKTGHGSIVSSSMSYQERDQSYDIEYSRRIISPISPPTWENIFRNIQEGFQISSTKEKEYLMTGLVSYLAPQWELCMVMHQRPQMNEEKNYELGFYGLFHQFSKLTWGMGLEWTSHTCKKPNLIALCKKEIDEDKKIILTGSAIHKTVTIELQHCIGKTANISAKSQWNAHDKKFCYGISADFTL